MILHHHGVYSLSILIPADKDENAETIDISLFDISLFTIVFNWNHFEIRLLNLRINFLFIADFLSSYW